jgi:hypothetical protein
MTQAANALQRAGLKVGIVANPTNEIRSDYLKLTGQTPNAGARVTADSSVDLVVTAIPQPITGFSAVTISNQNTDQRPLELYLIDLGTGQSSDMGAVAYGSHSSLSLQDGHVYELVALDTGLIGCTGKDPTIADCQRSLSYISGSKSGPVLPVIVV